MPGIYDWVYTLEGSIVDSRQFVWDTASLSWIKATASPAGAANVNVTNFPSVYPVNDNSGSLTVDAPEGTPVSVRLSDGTNFTSVASGRVVVDASQVAVPVTDNAGSLTTDTPQLPAALIGGRLDVNVGNTVTIADGGNIISIDTAQLPATLTGSGNLKVSIEESNISLAITEPVSVDDNGSSLTVDSPQLPSVLSSDNLKVSLQETTVTQPVSDAGGSLTVDAPVGTPVSTRLSDGATYLTTTSGRLHVDASGVAIPVTDNAGSLTIDSPQLPVSLSGSGNFSVNINETNIIQPVSQSGTWTVQPGNTANTTPWLTTINQGGNSVTVTGSNALKVDGSAVTQPISGIVTANAGTGTFVVGDGGASLSVDDNAGSLTVDAPVGTPVFTRLSDGTSALTTSAGRLAVDPSGVTLTDNIAQIGGNTVLTGNGITGTGSIRVTVASDNTAFGITITDGVNTPAVKAASTAPVATDPALVVAVSPNSTIAIGSVNPGTGATSLGKAEDAAHSSGDTGVQILGVRNDSNASLTSTNLDYSAIATNAAGAVKVQNEPGLQTTYGASTEGTFTQAANATDIFTITGSASKTVKILQIELIMANTAAANRRFFLVKRSTANTGGTSTTRTPVALDSSNASATATVLNYTANPTLGTTAGTIKTIDCFVTSNNGQAHYVLFDAAPYGQPIVLRGTSEVLAVNFGGVATPVGAVMGYNILFIEE